VGLSSFFSFSDGTWIIFWFPAFLYSNALFLLMKEEFEPMLDV